MFKRVFLFVFLFSYVPSTGFAQQTESELVVSLDEKTEAWVGTTWGLGLPQTTEPQKGKINCGMFVGLLLKQLGFNLNHKKLQRQPAELIIKSLSKKSEIQRYRNKKMSVFVADVKRQGDGWYVLGLDNHVGFVRVSGDDVRFVHADYVSEKVVKEPLIDAPSVISSRYRVIGRILGPKMMKSYKSKNRLKILGSW